MRKSASRSAHRPFAVVLLALLLACGIATWAAATAHAAQYKVVGCASTAGAPPYRTATNTISAQHPAGIFDFADWCQGAGGGPPGDAAFLRINEHEVSGNAGYGAYGAYIFEAPAYVHFKAAGAYTRQPNAFNAGWLTRFRTLDFSNNWTSTLNQGAGLPNDGLDWASSNIFGPHLWPFGSYSDFYQFAFEMICNLPGGCDRTNYNATDANDIVFIMEDDIPSRVGFTNTGEDLMAGRWVRGTQTAYWDAKDLGSGLRYERLRADGSQLMVVDYQSLGLCNVDNTQTNGEWAWSFYPCLQGGPHHRSYALDTSTLSDGAHNLQVCTQDFGQYQGAALPTLTG